MPVFHYQNGNLPEPADFRRLLREASEMFDPVENWPGDRQLSRFWPVKLGMNPNGSDGRPATRRFFA